MTVEHVTFDLPGYCLTEQLYRGPKTAVYRAITTTPTPGESNSVVIKFLASDYPTPQELLNFYHQYTVTQTLDHPGILHCRSLENYQRGYALVMEDVQGISLDLYRHRHYFSLVEILRLALQLADILQTLNQQGIIHKDVKPANILVHPETQQVWLIDFGLSSLLPRETPTVLSPHRLEGTLAYLSPEQTGRMNRGIDYRSDFYSLGVTLYELLTGQLPFASLDITGSHRSQAHALIHCHLAKIAPPVHQMNPAVPVALSDLVAKLMAKNAEDRYQSAAGLKHDLEQCLQAWLTTGQIPPFPLGQLDLSDRLIIPEKLYGRASEVAALLQAFDHVSQGAAEMVLVSGFSGIGKTAVIHEVQKPIVRQQGYFIRGKYDPFQRNIPFSAIVQAFRDLMGQLLSEPSDQLQTWKKQILDVVGEHGQVLIEVIPELERLIGVQPVAPELSGTAAQHRFNLLMQKFMAVFTAGEHPLVLFLDDLQWADLASLQLLQVLMQDTKHLLVLGAYRDNEVSPIHPLLRTVDTIQAMGVQVQRMTLHPLSFDDLNHWVADTLHCAPAIAQPLTELVAQKTQGNPFFATQFLKVLYAGGQITFDHDTRCWQCDIAAVKALALTDDVVGFLALQLQKLPPATLTVLQRAACLGTQFDLAMLAITCETTEFATAEALWPALQNSLILPTSNIYKFYRLEAGSRWLPEPLQQGQTQLAQYKFAHDCIQQAAYSLIPESQRSAWHLGIGRLLLAKTTSHDRDHHLCAIVNQINFGLDRVTTTAERYEIAHLNYLAGQKAALATAYAAALSYWKTGISLLDAHSWQQEYELTLNLYQSLASALYVGCHYTELDECMGVVLQHAQNLHDQIPIYEIQISALIAQHKIVAGIQVGLDVLQALKVKMPRKADFLKVTLALVKTKLLLGHRKIRSLLNLPDMQDPKALAAMQILSILLSSTLIADPLLFVLILCKQIELSLRYGNHPRSTLAYACYGTTLCGFVNDIEAGYQFGQLAIQLLQRFHTQSLSAKVLAFAGLTTVGWKQHLQDTLPLYQSGYQSGIEAGDLEPAAWNAINDSYTSFYIGMELNSLERKVQLNSQAIAKIQQFMPLDNNEMLRQLILNLLGQGDNPCELVGTAYDEYESVRDFQAAQNRMSQAYLYISKLMLCYWFGDYAGALQAAQLAKPSLDSVAGMPVVALFHFYRSLTALAMSPTLTPQRRKAIMKSLRTSQQKMRHWAKFAPMNFQHKFDLIAAEYQRFLGQEKSAMDLYDRAIAGAKAHGYIQEEAMANELAAKFYLDLGKEKIAQVYLIEAYYAYVRWGSQAKVDDLEQRYFSLLTPIFQAHQVDLNAFSTLTTLTQSLTHQTTSHEPVQELDLLAAIQAAQSLSHIIELPVLIDRLCHILVESSGAETCKVILAHSSPHSVPETQTIWQVYGMQGDHANGEGLTLQLTHGLLADCHELPRKLIYQVQHRGEAIILGWPRDIASHQDLIDPTLCADEYCQRYQPQSMMALPLIHRGELRGIVYLENRHTAAVFTPDRQIVLEFLAAVAVSTLHNAQLYDAVAQRSMAIEASLDGIAILENDHYSFMNPSHAQMFGYEVAELIGQSWQCLYAPAQVDQFQSTVFPIVGRTGRWQGEMIAMHKDGSAFDQEVSLTLLPNQQLICICRNISDRKHTENNLAKSEAQFRSLVEDASDVIYAFNLEGIFTYVSPQITEICGYQPADLIGQPCSNFTYPTDVPLMLANFQQLVQTGQKQNGLEMRVPQKEGGWCWIVFNNSPIKDATGQVIGVQGIGRDVTAQKAALQERQRQEEALKAIVEGTAGKTGEDFYQACTKYLTEIFNIQYAFISKILDQTLTQSQMLSFWTGTEFLPPFVIDLANTPCLITYQNSTCIFSQHIQDHFPTSSMLADLGAESYMSVVIRDFEGNILGNLAIIDTKPLPAETSSLQFILQLFANRIAAEMKRQVDEDELRQANQRLELTNRELLRATRLKDEFLANMSHELRTPLNAILGLSESLQEEILGAINQRQSKAIATIERSGQHLLSLINDILEVSKIEAGQIELEITRASIPDLCASSLALVKQQALKKQIQLTTNLAFHRESIEVDERRLRQVLINLLNNAVKFTPNSGQVHLSVTSEDGIDTAWIVFTVTDTGIGIAPADQSKLFKPFVQIDSSLNRQYGGTGLGLTLVKQIVELHGGTVSLTSTVGQGSCFTVRLPDRNPKTGVIDPTTTPPD